MDYLLNCSVKVRKDKIQMSSKTNKATDPLKLPNNTNNQLIPQTRHILPLTVRVFRFCSRYLYFIQFQLFLQLVTFLNNNKCYPSVLHMSIYKDFTMHISLQFKRSFLKLKQKLIKQNLQILQRIHVFPIAKDHRMQIIKSNSKIKKKHRNKIRFFNFPFEDVQLYLKLKFLNRDESSQSLTT